MSNFTVNCLFYGEYPQLAERLLGSLGRWASSKDIRFQLGLNNVCAATDALVRQFASKTHWSRILNGPAPYYKYPLMRRMFDHIGLSTKYTMWFDDDSFILDSAPDTFFDKVANAMLIADMVGARYYMHLGGSQLEFIRAQPWYRQQITNKHERINFITGGWWTIRSDILQKWSWPPAVVEHNGGDLLLGALFKEQGYRLGNFTEHLGINCDESNRCSSAKRRGFSQRPVGWNYVKPPTAFNVDFREIIDGKNTHS